MSQKNQTPSLEVRAGPIVGTVWPKEITHNGGKWVEYSIRIQKRYKDQRSGEWKSTTYFRPEDMPKLTLVASRIFEHVTLREIRSSNGNGNAQ